MTVVGLTGSIGSGKSAAANIFDSLGAQIIDADILSRAVVAPDSEGLRQIADEFGSEMVAPDGTLDRKRLGAVVFQDEARKKELEAILHPKVRALFSSTLQNIIARSPDAFVVAVIPLLFESENRYNELEKIICVIADDEICIERIMQRDACDRAFAKKIFESQMSQQEKALRADIVIENNGSIEELKQKVTDVFKSLSHE